MPNNLLNPLWLGGAGTLLLFTTACGVGQPDAAGDNDTARLQPAQSGDVAGAANPAARKCLADGFELETEYVNGVPTGAYCVSKETGRRCEQWDYYRGECRLE